MGKGRQQVSPRGRTDERHASHSTSGQKEGTCPRQHPRGNTTCKRREQCCRQKCQVSAVLIRVLQWPVSCRCNPDPTQTADTDVPCHHSPRVPREVSQLLVSLQNSVHQVLLMPSLSPRGRAGTDTRKSTSCEPATVMFSLGTQQSHYQKFSDALLHLRWVLGSTLHLAH